MPAVTVRNLSEETHRALRLRAAAHGRSTEAEIRVILDEATRPPVRPRIGSALAELAREFGGVELDITRDTTEAAGANFE
jgi:plasmid stability protein